jgi:hypothetical protein
MRVSTVLALCAVCQLWGSDSWAKNGRGGHKGGGGKSAQGSASFHGKGGNKLATERSNRGKRKSLNHSIMHDTTGHVNDGDQPWSKHFAREQRKLDHRKQVADHLREVSDRNGNEHLKQVADDMEQRAQAHYDKQVEKIRQRYGLDEPVSDAGDSVNNGAGNPPGSDGDQLDGSGEAFNTANDNLSDGAKHFSGRENALVRQLRNEDRKLAKRMQTVQRMRQLAEQSGDEGMLQAADELEQRAWDHFDQRMTQIVDFQRRHDLPELSQRLAR